MMSPIWDIWVKPLAPMGLARGSRDSEVVDLLQQLQATNRARARYAIRWRPKFLAALALSRSPVVGCKAAHVSYKTMQRHRAEDPAFESQCLAAEEHATQLLRDRAFSLALEGTLEPVFWQGICVGHIRKHDGKLLVEVLRAHSPTLYRSPATAKVSLTTNFNGQGAQPTLILDATARDELVALRQEALMRISEGEARLLEQGASDA